MADNTDKHIKSLLYQELTYKVRGAVFTVYNTLGPGHKEVLYQRSLAKEFGCIGLPFERETNLKIKYKGEIVGEYKPDFIIDGKIILEIKAVEALPQHFNQQLIYYLKGTEFRLGLLVNFGPKLTIIRKIWSPPPRNPL